MAESVKRRVTAARLAVAFAAAATIAGATASAQHSVPQTATFRQAAYDAFLKIKSPNIVNGSLLFKDFKPGEIYSEKQANHLFLKVREAANQYLKIEDAAKQYIKGESSDFLKPADADARYIKLTDAVVHGAGSVFTETTHIAGASSAQLLDLPNLVTVDAINGQNQVQFTNNSGAPMTHASCGVGGTPSGVVQPGGKWSCDVNGDGAQTLQLFTGGVKPAVVTVNFSRIPDGVGVPGAQFTAQALIGLL